MWAHPDVAPSAADLDDVLGFVERAAAGASSGSEDLDAALESILSEADADRDTDAPEDGTGTEEDR